MINEKEEQVDFEQVFTKIGPLGQWQITNILWVFVIVAATGVGAMSWVFIAFDMDHRCVVPYCENTVNGSFLKNDSGITNSYKHNISYT